MAIPANITSSGEFIKPNEFKTAAYKTILESSQSTLIAVGTFRAVIDFAMGAFERAIFLDRDRAVCQFNRLHLRLINAISAKKELNFRAQRIQYLACFTFNWLSEEELKNISLENLAHLRLQEKEIPKDISIHIQFLVAIGKACGYGEGLLPSLAHDLLNKYHFASDSHASDSRYYWEDDGQWERLTTAIQEERISVVLGDLADYRAMASLTEKVKAMGSMISVLDISNVLEYLTPEETEEFLSHLEFLPLAEKAHVLLTALSGSPKVKNLKRLDQDFANKSVESFAYYYLPRKDFSKKSNA